MRPFSALGLMVLLPRRHTDDRFTSLTDLVIRGDISIRHDQSSDAPSRRCGRSDTGGPPRARRPGQGRSANLFVAYGEEKLFAYGRTGGSAWRASFKTMLTVCAIAALAATLVASPAARAGDDVDMLLVLGAA